MEERQPFPSLSDLRPALPYVPPSTSAHVPSSTHAHVLPSTSVTRGQREPQEQGEPQHIPPTAANNYPSTDSTRVPVVPGIADSLTRFVQSWKIFNHFVLHSGEYSGVPISRISWGNGNWFKKSGVRKIEGGMKSRFIYKVLFFDN